MLQHPISREWTGHAGHCEGLPDALDSAFIESSSDANIAARHLRSTLSAFDQGAYDGLSQELRARLRAHLEATLRDLRAPLHK
jgi:hypothetical protein